MNEMKQDKISLKPKVSKLSKVDCKILVLFRLIQNFKIWDLAMAKVKKNQYSSYLLFSPNGHRRNIKKLSIEHVAKYFHCTFYLYDINYV